MDRARPDLQHIATTIIEDFVTGIDLQPEVLAFLESVAGEANAAALQELLDSGDASGQSVLDLIFFPELTLRKRLEPLIHTGLTHEQTKTLAEILAAHQVPTAICFPEGETVMVTPPRWVLATAIARLRLAREIPQAMLDRLDETFGPEEARSYRTLLRTTRFPWTEEATAFLTGFLDRASIAPGQAGKFLELFEAALALLDDLRPNETVYTCLMDRKRFYHAAMDKAIHYAEISQGLPMEALLSKGITPPPMTKEEAMKRIQLLDGLSLTVYGRTEPLETPVRDTVPIDPGTLTEE